PDDLSALVGILRVETFDPQHGLPPVCPRAPRGLLRGTQMNADETQMKAEKPDCRSTSGATAILSTSSLSAFICVAFIRVHLRSKDLGSHHSLIPNFLPSHCAVITSTKSAAMNITPSAESSTYCPFSHSSQITTDTTSVPGL